MQARNRSIAEPAANNLTRPAQDRMGARRACTCVSVPNHIFYPCNAMHRVALMKLVLRMYGRNMTSVLVVTTAEAQPLFASPTMVKARSRSTSKPSEALQSPQTMYLIMYSLGCSTLTPFRLTPLKASRSGLRGSRAQDASFP